MEEIDIAKDERDLKRKLSVHVKPSDMGTRIFAVATAKGSSLNTTLKIPTVCGDPICEGVYDLVRDCYIASGVEFIDLGSIRIRAYITMEDMFRWEVPTPIPLLLLKRHWSDDQKQQFENWKQRFDDSEYDIAFLQLQEVY